MILVGDDKQRLVVSDVINYCSRALYTRNALLVNINPKVVSHDKRLWNPTAARRRRIARLRYPSVSASSPFDQPRGAFSRGGLRARVRHTERGRRWTFRNLSYFITLKIQQKTKNVQYFYVHVYVFDIEWTRCFVVEPKYFSLVEHATRLRKSGFSRSPYSIAFEPFSRTPLARFRLQRVKCKIKHDYVVGRTF